MAAAPAAAVAVAAAPRTRSRSLSRPPVAAAVEVSDLHVLFYVPNVIGYVRVALMLAAFASPEDAFEHDPPRFVLLLAASASLDWVDGTVARKLDQCSVFGAWLDVVIDNITRTLLWTRLSPQYGPFVACLEWVTFSCTHSLGAGWKTDFSLAPSLVTRVMAQGFKTPLGVWAIGGLWLLPCWMYAMRPASLAVVHDRLLGRALTPAEGTLLDAVWWVLVAGRVVCALVELWFCWAHVKWMCAETVKAREAAGAKAE